MELSIIFVNWNSLAFLRACLVSVYKQLQVKDFEIIVVDNASSEAGVDSLKQQFPEILLIKSETNLGFAGANNLGFRRCTGDHALFLNPDTELSDDAVDIMLEELKCLPDAGVVGCKLLNTDQSIQTSCIQKFPTIPNQLADFEYLRLRWPRFYLWSIDPLFAKGEKPVPVEVISGACMLLKREVFERVGMFTEDYFMYAEDLDLCYKVHKLGLRNYYVGKAEITHHGGQSSNQVKVNHWSVVMRFNAVQTFCAKHHGRAYGWLYRGTMGGAALGRVALLSLARILRGTDSRKQAVKNATSKWWAVLKWSFGSGSHRSRATTTSNN
jgi:N-acetylglucosaminyl-diphospho-decaprenol L-rhamnosyltransferase